MHKKQHINCTECTTIFARMGAAMPVLFQHLENQIFCHHSCDENPEKLHFYLHAHERMELFYFISGNVEYMVEGSLYQLSPGDIIITRSAEVHMPIIHPGAPYERISIQFNPSIIENIDSSGVLLKPFLDRSLGQKNLYPPCDQHGVRFVSCFDGFDLPDTPPARRINIIHVLLGAMIGISRQFEGISHEEKYPDIDDLSGQLINYINQELFSKISVSTISQHFFLSESQVNRIFKKATGSSIWEYIRIKRLLAAREKILAGESAASVAASCGYQDYSSFYRAYTDRFKVSPSKTDMQNEIITNLDEYGTLML